MFPKRESSPALWVPPCSAKAAPGASGATAHTSIKEEALNGLHDPRLWMTLAGVVAAWALVASGIRRWGPGKVRHVVDCPETKKKANVVVLQKEATWGTYRAADITGCSRFPGAPVTCDKGCLTQL